MLSATFAAVSADGARGGKNACEYVPYTFTVVELAASTPASLTVAQTYGLKASNVCSSTGPDTPR